MTRLEAELRALDAVLRAKGVPFPTDEYSTHGLDESAVPAGAWPATSIEEIRTWFDWVGPESGRAGVPRPPFFAEFRKLTWAETSASWASLRVWFEVPTDTADPWVQLATSDAPSKIIYNAATSTVFALYLWEHERFAEITQSFPDLIKLWREIIETKLEFDSETLKWTTTDPNTDWSDPIWAAAGII
ncbi:MAG: hypothetical protein ACOH1J_08995 [Microbacteriaceae bacterium]